MTQVERQETAGRPLNELLVFASYLVPTTVLSGLVTVITQKGAPASRLSRACCPCIMLQETFCECVIAAFRVLYLAMISFATVSRKAFWHGVRVGVGHPLPTAIGKDPGACLP